LWYLLFCFVVKPKIPRERAAFARKLRNSSVKTFMKGAVSGSDPRHRAHLWYLLFCFVVKPKIPRERAAAASCRPHTWAYKNFFMQILSFLIVIHCQKQHQLLGKAQFRVLIPYTAPTCGIRLFCCFVTPKNPRERATAASCRPHTWACKNFFIQFISTFDPRSRKKASEYKNMDDKNLILVEKGIYYFPISVDFVTKVWYNER